MSDLGRRERRPKGVLGLWSSFVLHVALLAILACGLDAARRATQEDLIDYAPTENARKASLKALEKAAKHQFAKASNVRELWIALVREEAEAGDFAAARGLLLLSTAILPPADASAIRADAPDGTENAIAAAALRLLPDDLTQTMRPHVRLAEGLSVDLSVGDSARADAAGEELRNLAASWAGDGSSVDFALLGLLGIGEALAFEASEPETARAARAGASALRSALRANRLEAGLSAHFIEKARSCLPEAALRANLAANEALASPDAVRRAFASALSAPCKREFTGDFSVLDQIVRTTTVSAALDLLSSGRSRQDIDRLALVAIAGGDRSGALAGRLDTPLPDLARGQFAGSRALTWSLIGLGLGLFAALVSTLTALSHALARAARR